MFDYEECARLLDAAQKYRLVRVLTRICWEDAIVTDDDPESEKNALAVAEDEWYLIHEIVEIMRDRNFEPKLTDGRTVRCRIEKSRVALQINKVQHALTIEQAQHLAEFLLWNIGTSETVNNLSIYCEPLAIRWGLGDASYEMTLSNAQALAALIVWKLGELT